MKNMLSYLSAKYIEQSYKGDRNNIYHATERDVYTIRSPRNVRITIYSPKISNTMKQFADSKPICQ